MIFRDNFLTQWPHTQREMMVIELNNLSKSLGKHNSKTINHRAHCEKDTKRRKGRFSISIASKIFRDNSLI